MACLRYRFTLGRIGVVIDIRRDHDRNASGTSRRTAYPPRQLGAHADVDALDASVYDLAAVQSSKQRVGVNYRKNTVISVGPFGGTEETDVVRYRNTKRRR